MNLISNAMKFTETGAIDVSVEDRGAYVECSVKDTGCGIPEEGVPKIFDKFEQFHIARTKRGSEEKGTGLGLAIAKGLVMAHKGKIGAESKVGVGTRIFFTLPKKAE